MIYFCADQASAFHMKSRPFTIRRLAKWEKVQPFVPSSMLLLPFAEQRRPTKVAERVRPKSSARSRAQNRVGSDKWNAIRMASWTLLHQTDGVHFHFDWRRESGVCKARRFGRSLRCTFVKRTKRKRRQTVQRWCFVVVLKRMCCCSI